MITRIGKTLIDVNTKPTEAQKESGNYKKGHISLNGMQITIENPAGSVRSGTAKDGRKWSIKMQHHYGYIKGTVGKDKDHIDIFIKPGTTEVKNVYIINQCDPADKTKFDEHKVVAGAKDTAEAKKIYFDNYETGWKGFMSIFEVPIDEFKDWAYKKTLTKGIYTNVKN